MTEPQRKVIRIVAVGDAVLAAALGIAIYAFGLRLPILVPAFLLAGAGGLFVATLANREPES